jgi:methylmalonyl-CoA mutase C-terminal domain/subunit
MDDHAIAEMETRVRAGTHDYLFPKVIELLKEKGADDMIVFGG